MDDVTLSGHLSSVADDVTKISTLGVNYGLRLNFAKCEAISLCGITGVMLRAIAFSNLQLRPPHYSARLSVQARL